MSSSKTFAIQIINNDVFELTESFTVMLNENNSDRTALINQGIATGTIFDDDMHRESRISVIRGR